MIDFVK